MKWSWPLGRIAGIRLQVHATFLLLLAWLAILDYRDTGTVAGAMLGVVFTLALFASVLLHELGHAIAARRVGVATRDITLLPIGGVARLESIPRKPRDELGVALAGPAVTVLIVLVLAAALRMTGQPILVEAAAFEHADAASFVARLLWANVALLVFNLLPAFPMDGGRVLRAALALRRDYRVATDIATRIGRAFALVFAVIGLFFNPFLVLIALFIWVSAAAESAMLQQSAALAGIPVRQVMVAGVRSLAPGDRLSTALQYVVTGFQHDFPVVDGDRVIGVLTRERLLSAVAQSGAESLVGAAMTDDFRTAEVDEPAGDALARLHECSCRTAPVLEDGRLAGLLTLENVAEFVMIEAALHGRHAARATR